MTFDYDVLEPMYICPYCGGDTELPEFFLSDKEECGKCHREIDCLSWDLLEVDGYIMYYHLVDHKFPVPVGYVLEMVEGIRLMTRDRQHPARAI